MDKTEFVDGFGACTTFKGAVEGYSFKTGDRGTGYYYDAPSNPPPEGAIVCENCGKYEEKLLRCTACKVTTYCSVECQKAKWKEHKKDCKTYRDLRVVKPKQTLRESMGLGREIAYKDWKDDEKGVLVTDFAKVLGTGASIAGVHEADARVNAFMTNTGRLLDVVKTGLPRGVHYQWSKTSFESMPLLGHAQIPYLPLPHLDLKFRAMEDGKFVHLTVLALKDMGSSDNMSLLPTLELAPMEEPGFKIIACNTDTTPPQLMLPDQLPEFATCGQKAPTEGFRITERYLRFLFRCVLRSPQHPSPSPSQAQAGDLVEELGRMCEFNGFALPKALWEQDNRTIVLDMTVCMMLGVLTMPAEEQVDSHSHGHSHGHEHGHDHGQCGHASHASTPTPPPAINTQDDHDHGHVHGAGCKH